MAAFLFPRSQRRHGMAPSTHPASLTFSVEKWWIVMQTSHRSHLCEWLAVEEDDEESLEPHPVACGLFAGEMEERLDRNDAHV